MSVEPSTPDVPLLPERAESLDDAGLLRAFELMRLARTVDGRLQALYRQGRIVGGVYSQEGNEATSVGAALALSDGDCLFPIHRGLGARLTRGDRLDVILAQLLGRAGGPTAGRDSGLHHDVTERRIFAMISPLGTQTSVACGAALAMRQRGEDGVAMVFTGDGSTALGEQHEGFNFAAVLRLPVIVVVENNLFAFSTPNAGEFACESLEDRARGYGMAGETVDGTDVLAVHAAARRAVKRARAGGGPTLLESRALRLRGHSEADAHQYVPTELLAEGRRRDPLRRLEATLRQRGLLDDDAVATLQAAIDERLDAALTRALSLPEADPTEVAWGVFSEEGHPNRGRGVPAVPGLAAEGAASPGRLEGDPS